MAKKKRTTAARLARIETLLTQIADRLTALEDDAGTRLDRMEVEDAVEEVLRRDSFTKRVDALFQEAGEVRRRQDLDDGLLDDEDDTQPPRNPGPTTTGGSPDVDV